LKEELKSCKSPSSSSFFPVFSANYSNINVKPVIGVTLMYFKLFF
jgi:hypothetical protein